MGLTLAAPALPTKTPGAIPGQTKSLSRQVVQRFQGRGPIFQDPPEGKPEKEPVSQLLCLNSLSLLWHLGPMSPVALGWVTSWVDQARAKKKGLSLHLCLPAGHNWTQGPHRVGLQHENQHCLDQHCPDLGALGASGMGIGP